MGWDLGKVKPWVKKAGQYYGEKYAVKNIGGWRAHGSVPGSAHPEGLALDLMTSSRSKGDAIAADAIANHKAWNVTQVIWNRQIWTSARPKWRPYRGPSAHTDHVHLTFGNSAGKGTPNVGGAVTGLVGALGNPAESMTGVLKGIGEQIRGIAEGAASVGQLAEVVTKAFLPSNMVRAAAGTMGTLFILIGIYFLSREARHA